MTPEEKTIIAVVVEKNKLGDELSLKGLEAYRDSGIAFIELKKVHGKHGNWIKWVDENVSIGYQTARRNARLAENWDTIKKAVDEGIIKPNREQAIDLIRNPREKKEEKKAKRILSKAQKKRKKNTRIRRKRLQKEFKRYLKTLSHDEIRVFADELGRGFRGDGWVALDKYLKDCVEYDSAAEYEWMPAVRRQETKEKLIAGRTVLALNRKRMTEEQKKARQAKVKELEESLKAHDNSPPHIFYSGRGGTKDNPENILEDGADLMLSYKYVKKGTHKQRLKNIEESRK